MFKSLKNVMNVIKSDQEETSRIQNQFTNFTSRVTSPQETPPLILDLNLREQQSAVSIDNDNSLHGGTGAQNL